MSSLGTTRHKQNSVWNMEMDCAPLVKSSIRKSYFLYKKKLLKPKRLEHVLAKIDY